MLWLTAAAAGLFLWAAASDVATRRIPNRLTAALALVGLVRLAADLAAGGGWTDPALDLAAAAAVLVLGAAGFAAGVLGGGDVKLAAAAALWLGAGALAPFLMVSALAGGLLALAYLALGILRRGSKRPVPSLPYGVALAAGGLVATLHLG